MPLVCSVCAEEALACVEAVPEGGLSVPTSTALVQTTGLYRGVCPSGHEVLMYADFQPFELLFESAMEAFADAYLRESVSSFAAALERFYEFSIATFLLNSGGSIEDFDKTWKSVKRSSERQLGMYIGIYSVSCGRHPRILDDDCVKFRNDVIHNGHFPAPNKALDFGKIVYEIIVVGIKELRLQFGASMEEARKIVRKKAEKQLKPGENPGYFGMGTTVSLMILDEPPSLEDALHKVSARMKRHRAQ